MAEDVPNPHDHFFRKTIALPNAVANIARQALPPEVLAQLDLSQMDKVETSWVDEDLRVHFADALFRVRLTGNTREVAHLLILCEHKSYPDQQVAFQVLRYMVQVWRDHLQNSAGPLPTIIPLVLYHGREAWTVPRGFEAMFVPRPEFAKFVPRFEYSLLDISALTDGDVRAMEDPYVRASLRVMWLIFRVDLLEQLPGVLKDLPRDDTGVLQFLETMCRYLLSGGRVMQSELGTVLQQTYTNFDDIKVEFFEELREKVRRHVIEEVRETVRGQMIEEVRETVRGQVIEEVREEVMEEMRLQNLKDGLVRLLRRKFRDQLPTDEVLASLQALTIPQLETLTEDLLDFQSPADFQRWLDKQG